MASIQQLPQTAQVREMEEFINNSDFQQVSYLGCSCSLDWLGNHAY